jgi:hypothetical protein
MTELPAQYMRPSTQQLGTALQDAIWLYAISTLIIVAGALCGVFHSSPNKKVMGLPGAMIQASQSWDGPRYLAIAENGYSYAPHCPSNVAFFPLYPLAIWTTATATSLPYDLSAIAVSHIATLAAFTVLSLYFQRRAPRAGCGHRWMTYVVALYPCSLFLRMGYSESLFLFLYATFLLGCEHKWDFTVVAFIVGAATACRLVGVVLLLPLAVHCLQVNNNRRAVPFTVGVSQLIGIWGLAGFALYLWYYVGSPLAFATTQHDWRICPPLSLANKWIELISGAPIIKTYISGECAYWRSSDQHAMFIFSLQWANPIYFLTALGSVYIGSWLRILTKTESLCGFAFLSISYVGRAAEMGMTSQGRYTAVVIPVFLVWGCLLEKVPWFLRILIVGVSGSLLFIYSWSLAAGRTII